MRRNNEYYWFHNDHLGTPQKITTSSGAVVWSAKYSSFGKAIIEIETVENNLRFPGQYEDRETGLYYNYYRYYGPTLGIYLEIDPSHSLIPKQLNIPFLLFSILHDPHRLTNYAYARSNAVKYSDVKGLICGTSWTDHILNDKPAGCNFSACCQAHDDCYDKYKSPCRPPKKICDKAFLICMLGSNKDPACWIYGVMYYLGVDMFGWVAY